MTGYDEKTLEVVFHFDTAWSPPMPVIKRAAELYPALRFELRYFECGCCFNGLFRCSAGAVESNKCGAYFGTAAAEALGGSALRFPPHEN